jgi:hypothetical protein
MDMISRNITSSAQDLSQDNQSTIQDDGFLSGLGMYNNVVVIGKILTDAEFFPTRSGKPKISFRVAIPRTPDLPYKRPVSSDFFTVLCYGERFVPLLDMLTTGRWVVVVGWAQSRDVDTPDGRRTVNEIGARAVVPVLDPALLAALDHLVQVVLGRFSPQDLQSLREALIGGNGSELPEAIRDLAPEGQLHPEVRQAILRVLREGE